MSLLTNIQVKNITDQLTDDERELKRLFRQKKTEFHSKNAPVEDYDREMKAGWEFIGESPSGIKINLKKEKEHNIKFEDRIWCMFYNLGYRHLNLNQTFNLPNTQNHEDIKQIDVVAIDPENKIIFLVKCKSSAKLQTGDFKNEIDLTVSIKLVFTRAMQEVFNRDYKVKLIFATNNIRVQPHDSKRLDSADIFYLNNNGCDYIENIIKHYKSSSLYQFLGIVFKGSKIRNEVISIPALQGKMGSMDYYMFSIQPSLLLQIGFVLHRVKANEVDFPTYQRMLVPNRLKNIAEFLKTNDSDGNHNFFPNSVIINFSTIKRITIKFEPRHTARESCTNTKYGMLEIPMAFGIANIIDGQHRIYGYAATDFVEKDSIPVVAFKDMSTDIQLKMFMDINENQKAVSASLRLALQADLHWSSDRIDSRMGALKSAIITALGDSSYSFLYGKIAIGEDKAELSFKPFYKALGKCSLIPTASRSKFNPAETALYDTDNLNNEEEMNKTKSKTFNLINSCYEFIEKNHPNILNEPSSNNLILSNRGTYAFIMIIGSLHEFFYNKEKLSKNSTNKERISKLEKYLYALCLAILSIDEDLKNELLNKLGQGAESLWFFTFQSLINNQIPEYETDGLIEWKEKHDKTLQANGLMYSQKIENHMKKVIISTLKKAYDKNWELEIAKWKRECEELASKEQEQNYKEGFGSETIGWQTKFNLLQYKEIIERFWSNMPADKIDNSEQFQNVFSINDDQGGTSKASKVKWISHFNKFRNKIAHKGTNEQGLTKSEVEFLYRIYIFFKLDEQ